MGGKTGGGGGGGRQKEIERRSYTAITSSNVCLAGGSVKHPIN